MTTRTDFQLIREYAERGSQEAFAELVARHWDLVYTAAVRQVGDRHAADDVAQVVSIVLVKRAESLGPQTILSAWLLVATRHAAMNWRKMEHRRRRRETAAARQRAEQRSMATGMHTAAGGESNPHLPAGSARSAADALDERLDDALAKLSAAARDALVLRFFEGRSFQEVGDELGISAEAAKQRVFRGLERLRAVLGRRGLHVSSEGLAVTLAATAVSPAPAGWAAKCAATATSATAAAPYAVMVSHVLAAMGWAKAATTVVVAGVIVVAGGLGGTLLYLSGRDDVAPTAAASFNTTAGTAGRTVPTALQVGDQAPPLVGVNLSGRPVRLADFLGKHVLLHPWRTRDPDRMAQGGPRPLRRRRPGRPTRRVLRRVRRHRAADGREGGNALAADARRRRNGW